MYKNESNLHDSLIHCGNFNTNFTNIHTIVIIYSEPTKILRNTKKIKKKKSDEENLKKKREIKRN